MKRENIPNILTILRMLLAIPIVYSLLIPHYELAFYLLIIAAVTDSIDGYIARQFQWSSRLGSMLDPLADKILMVSVFIVLAYVGEVPMWLLSMVLLREMVLITGTIVLHLAIGPYQIHPIIISKVNTFLQIFLTFILVFNKGFAMMPIIWVQGLMCLVFATTFASMLAYIWIWTGKILGRREI